MFEQKYCLKMRDISDNLLRFVVPSWYAYYVSKNKGKEPKMFGTRVLVSELEVGMTFATSGLTVMAREKVEGTPYYSVTLGGYGRPSKVRFHGSESIALA